MTAKLRWSLVVAGEAAVGLFYLVSWSETAPPVFRQMQVGILTILGGLGWLLILRRPQVLPRLLVVAPLALLGSLAVTSVTSAYPSLSWFTVWQCAAFTGILWLLCVQAGHPNGRRNLVAAMGIVVTIVIGVYLVSVAVAWQEWLAFGFPLSSLPLRPLGGGGLVISSLWMADAVGLCAPVVVVAMWNANARLPAISLALAAMVAIVLSGTRSVLLLVVILGVVGAVLVIRKRGGRVTTAVATVSAIVVSLVGLSVVLLAGRQFDEGRLSAYASAVDRFASSPLVGRGPGSYGVGRMGDSVDGITRLAFPDSHNIFLTSAAESGVIGVVGLAVAIGSFFLVWREVRRRAALDTTVRTAALFGVAVIAGHAMVEVVLLLLGTVLLLVAGIAIGVTSERTPLSVGPRSGKVDAALIAGLAVAIIGSGLGLISSETRDLVAKADGELVRSPQAALTMARQATDAAADYVPAWWVRMVAADTMGDTADALASARRLTALEGFGQEWLSLSVLATRAGDEAEGRQAMERAVGHLPLDPVVDLNAAVAAVAAGSDQDARDAAGRLLSSQPDIEPILADSLPDVATVVAEIRADTAERLVSTSPSSSILIALSGEDHALADTLADQIGRVNPESAQSWRTIIAAWFDDGAERSSFEATSLQMPTDERVVWSWRLATHACDAISAGRWQRAVEIGVNIAPVMPTKLVLAPEAQVRQFPPRYPTIIWRTDQPTRPYVAGIWTFELGRPPCVSEPAG